MTPLRSLLVCATALICVAARADTLNFGIISTDSSAVLKQRWQPLIDDLNRQTGLDVKAFFATDYAGIIEGMRFNKVQIGYFGNASALEAVERSNGEVFAKVQHPNGEAGYYSVLITNVNSRFKTLDDVFRHPRDVTLGYGDPNSTSGSLVPGYYLFAKRNVSVRNGFKAVLPSSHEANLLAVVNNKIDVATNNTDALGTLKAGHPAQYAQVRVLWTSPQIASDPLVWRKDLPPDVKAKLRDFFYRYGRRDPHEKDVMAGIRSFVGFLPSSDRQLVPVRKIVLFQRKQKIEADTTLSDSERNTQAAAIDAQLSALETAAQP
ncbi:phosphonate ABC transporter substrate-binding protein [Burkholderia alba]|uniref:phosphonate ABC transporter substrate-binding protein n=1 Tax=Burkholderia alba TaxID=2683677 RepID=UPI002B054013|nr:phosphonate ABC transporter substrate-binding protein [Burkholderia alba]